MQTEAERLMRAGLALQIAALEWDNDTSGVQSEARQAMIGVNNALNEAHHAEALMKCKMEQRRRGPDVRMLVSD